MSGKGSKMQNLIDYRVRITLNDGRQLTGLLMAFDRYMNVVLADTEEFRRIKRKATTKAQSIEQEEKRTLGLIMLRGEQIISLSVDAPPVSDNIGRLAPIQSGNGVAKPIGRGLPANVAAAPPGLSGPVAGVGNALPRQQPAFGRGMVPPPPGMAPPGVPPPGFAPPGFRPQ